LNNLLRAKLLAGVAGLGLGSLLIHPFGAVKAHASVDRYWPEPKSILRSFRSWSDLARTATRKELSGRGIAMFPLCRGWLENDVHNARSHMNLSRWGEYSLEKKQELLTKLAAAVRSRQMPPARYTLMHPGAKLSQTDLEDLYQWARGERRRLKSAAGAQSTASSDAAPSQ